MEPRHEHHVHDSLCPTKTDGSSPTEKEFEASCDPWHQFWLLLRLPALNFLGIAHVRMWPSQSCGWTWCRARVAGTPLQGFMPRKSCCHSRAISPLSIARSLRVTQRTARFPGHPHGSWGQGTPPFPGVLVSKARCCKGLKPSRCRQGEEHQAHCLCGDSPHVYQVGKPSLVQCWMLLAQPITAKLSEAAGRYQQCYSLRKGRRPGSLYSSCGSRP